MLVENTDGCQEEGGMFTTLRPERLVRICAARPVSELHIQRLHVDHPTCKCHNVTSYNIYVMCITRESARIDLCMHDVLVQLQNTQNMQPEPGNGLLVNISLMAANVSLSVANFGRLNKPPPPSVAGTTFSTPSCVGPGPSSRDRGRTHSLQQSETRACL